MIMPREEDIYEEHVLDHYEDPYHRGDLPEATHMHEGDNPLCGDVVHVDLQMADNGKVNQAWFDGEGCVISQSSASMLMEKIEGMTREEIKQFSADDMLRLFGPKLTPNRQKCCLLPWRVVQAALHSPVEVSEDDAGSNVSRFGGPSLKEES
jgi:nitrogen fixation protein NifU and related proteins